MTLLIDKNVWWLDISMSYIVLMQVLKSFKHLSQNILDFAWTHILIFMLD